MKKILATITYLAFACMSISAHSPATNEESQIRLLATKWEQAWNRHDMKTLFQLFTSDADFVNVAGHHWKGRPEIEAQHTERLGQFKDSIWTTKTVSVKLLRPDFALVHVDWGIRGDTDPDGTARKPREGIFTWLVLKHKGKWQIRAAQNTNLNNPPIVSK